MEHVIIACKILVQNLKKGNNFEDPDLDERILLKTLYRNGLRGYGHDASDSEQYRTLMKKVKRF
jgi:hypothetical protein